MLKFYVNISHQKEEEVPYKITMIAQCSPNVNKRIDYCVAYGLALNSSDDRYYCFKDREGKYWYLDYILETSLDGLLQEIYSSGRKYGSIYG